MFPKFWSYFFIFSRHLVHNTLIAIVPCPRIIIFCTCFFVHGILNEFLNPSNEIDDSSTRFQAIENLWRKRVIFVKSCFPLRNGVQRETTFFSLPKTKVCRRGINFLNERNMSKSHKENNIKTVVHRSGIKIDTASICAYVVLCR